MERMQMHRFRMFALLSAALIAGLLAGCIDESPLAFSPDGKTLAFVTAEPHRTQDGGFTAGAQTFRLMVLDEQRQIRVLETSTEAMLSAPGWSPDGKRLAYLRVPLPSKQEAEAQRKALDERANSLQKMVNPAWMAWVTGSKDGVATQPGATEPAPTEPPPAESAATQPAITQLQDQALPPLKSTFVSTALMMLSADAPATLVVREVDSGTMLSNTELELLTSSPDYATTQPQFDLTGRQVYVAAGNLVLAIDLDRGEKRVLASGGAPATLSPDGRTLALTTDDALGLIATDGSLALYRRLPTSPASGPAWIDARTVAVLQSKVHPAVPIHPETPQTAVTTWPASTQPAATQPAASATYLIHRVRTDGTLLQPVEIPVPAATPTDNINQLAVAPGGRYLAISHGHGVTFASLDGRTAQFVGDPQALLEQATFSPDSRRVAVKAMTEAQDKSVRTNAIVFYSPEGKELYRVAIPAVEGATTQAAGRE
jgi:hypothetical protein